MKELQCKHCGSYDFMVDAEVKQRLPVGFGFRDSKFVIDSIESKGYKGVCLDCRKEQVIFTSSRSITRTPRSINNKIKKAKAGVKS